MTIAEPTYALSAITSLIASTLLLRQYRATRTRLVLWSFRVLRSRREQRAGFVDLVLVPSTDLALARTLAALAGLVALLYGLIWETRR